MIWKVVTRHVFTLMPATRSPWVLRDGYNIFFQFLGFADMLHHQLPRGTVDFFMFVFFLLSFAKASFSQGSEDRPCPLGCFWRGQSLGYRPAPAMWAGRKLITSKLKRWWKTECNVMQDLKWSGSVFHSHFPVERADSSLTFMFGPWSGLLRSSTQDHINACVIIWVRVQHYKACSIEFP